MNTERELQLLQEWLTMRIQLLPYCFDLIEGKRIEGRFSKYQLPSFEEFKDSYESRYKDGCFKESIHVFSNNTIGFNSVVGLGAGNGIAYRLYSDYLGVKYYPKSVNPEFTITQGFHTLFNKRSK